MKSEEAVRLLKGLGACGFPGEKAVQMSRFADFAEAWDSWPVEWVADRFWLLFRVAGKYGSTSHRFACGVLGECLRPSLRRATTLGSQARRAVNRVSRLLCRYARKENILQSDFAAAALAAATWAEARGAEAEPIPGKYCWRLNSVLLNQYLSAQPAVPGLLAYPVRQAGTVA